MKEKNKGVVYFGDSFVVGLIGNNASGDLVSNIEKVCKEMSTKQVKSNIKKDVKFDFKKKGEKPVVTKDICQFTITGAGFKGDKIIEILTAASAEELD